MRDAPTRRANFNRHEEMLREVDRHPTIPGEYSIGEIAGGWGEGYVGGWERFDSQVFASR
jgi:hypothetical protein